MVFIYVSFSFFFGSHQPPKSTFFPYTTLFRSPPLRQQLGRQRDLLSDVPGLPGAQRGLLGDVLPLSDSRQNIPEKTSRSEEHTSELQSRGHLVCRLLLEKKKTEYQYCISLDTY